MICSGDEKIEKRKFRFSFFAFGLEYCTVVLYNV